jgi:type I restriction enzyme S subunit
MELSPGYKQTEVGEIPADWEVNKINQVCVLINGRGFKPHEWGKRGLPIIRIQNLNGSGDFNYYLGSYNPKILIEHGQLLFAWSGSRGTSFGPHIWNGDRALLNYHTWKIATDKAKINEDYFFHALKNLTSFIEDNAHGASALVHTQKREMEHFHVLVPTNAEEQRAIAAALSDADSLIASLDALIAKKRDIKQAAMQQLLTGKTRLPGFSHIWICKTLGELGSFSKGKGIRRDEVQTDGHPCIRYGEIYTHHNDHIRQFYSFISPEVARTSKPIKKGDLLFTGSGETAEDIGRCVAFLGEEKAYAGGDIVILSTDGCDSKFLGYLMNHSNVAEQKARMAQGDAVVHISATNLGRVQVSLPDRCEQEAIGNVLWDMDAEIQGLEDRRDKTAALKQGMMQELLTGRIRLV